MTKQTITFISLVASVIAIFAFLTGYPNLDMLISPKTELDKRSILIKNDRDFELKAPEVNKEEFQVKKYPFQLKAPKPAINMANALAQAPKIKIDGFSMSPASIADAHLEKEMKKYIKTKEGRMEAELTFLKMYGIKEEGMKLSNLIEVDSCYYRSGSCFMSVIDNY